MKKHIQLLFLFICSVLSITVFAEIPTTEIVANIKATSNDEAKTIYAKINKEKVENKIELLFETDADGNITIYTNKFKLGSMPFSSYLYFTIPNNKIVKNDHGDYKIENLEGYYKVLSTKSPAFLSGTLNENTGVFVVTMEKKNRKVVLEISY